MEILLFLLIVIIIAFILDYWPVLVVMFAVIIIYVIFLLISNIKKGKKSNIEKDENTFSLNNAVDTVSPSNVFYSKIVGVTYTDAKKILPTINGGEQLSVIREKNNEYDKNAIALYYKYHKLGHLSREVAADIAPFIDNGTVVKVFVENITGGNGKTYGCNIEIEVF